jgi:hypothetical protein
MFLKLIISKCNKERWEVKIKSYEQKFLKMLDIIKMYA